MKAFLIALLCTYAFQFCVFSQIVIPPNDDTVNESEAFVKNQGQLVNMDGHSISDILYHTNTVGNQLFLAEDFISFVLIKYDLVGIKDSIQRIDMNFEIPSVETGPTVTAHDAIDCYYNYYYPHNDPGGDVGVPAYMRINWAEAWDDIDIQVYGNNTAPKLYFIVKTSGDPDDIQLSFSGTDSVYISTEGDSLVLDAPLGSIVHFDPIAYNIISGDDSVVACKYTIDSLGNIGFDLPNGYNTDYNLVIEIDMRTGATISNKRPPRRWHTYIGGGSDRDRAESVFTDEDGFVYISGGSNSFQFPTTPNVVQEGLAAFTDAWVGKFSGLGVQEWGTFFGGNLSESAQGVGVDSNSNVFIYGRTRSTNLQTKFAGNGEYQQDSISGGAGDYDLFIVKLSSNAQALKYSTYYGGTLSESAVYNGLRLDIDGDFYIVGRTASSNFNTKTKTGAYNQSFGGSDDGFLLKFDNDGVLDWATFIGGNKFDQTNGVIIDSSKNVFLTGQTNTTTAGNNNSPPCGVPTNGGFPMCNPSGSNDYYQSSSGSIFITQFDSSGVLSWSTFFGGNDLGAGTGIALRNDNLYITGYTRTDSGTGSVSPPCLALTNGKFPNCDPGGGSYLDSLNDGETDAFISRFNSSHQLRWSTLFGGDEFDNSNAIITNDNGNVFFAGFTNSTNFPTKDKLGNDYFFDSTQGNSGSTTDGFIAMFNSDGIHEWSTFYGGSGALIANEEAATSLASHLDDYIYMVGVTNSRDLHYDCDPSIGQYCRNATSPAFELQEGFIALFDLELQPPSGIIRNLNDNNNRLQIYPNPTFGVIDIMFPTQNYLNCTISIYNSVGQVVYSSLNYRKTSTNTNRIDLSGFSKGLYLIQVNLDDELYLNKIIKQ